MINAQSPLFPTTPLLLVTTPKPEVGLIEKSSLLLDPEASLIIIILGAYRSHEMKIHYTAPLRLLI